MRERGFEASAGGSDGRWIFWKRDVWSATGRDGRELPTGYWCLDFGATRCRVVTYQLLEHRLSGAAFLFVDPHLEFQQSPHGDRVRGEQIRAAIERSQHLADSYRAEHPDEPAVRVVIAGDLNLSKRLGDQDPRGEQLRGHGFTDAVQAAVSVHNRTYTTNKKWRGVIDHWAPTETEHRVDQIWVPAGVHVTEWTHRLQSPTRSSSDHDMLVARLVYPGSRPR
jgi:endonuclease/exonuclease/phosphatase family metal-dependent hydrolase